MNWKIPTVDEMKLRLMDSALQSVEAWIDENTGLFIFMTYIALIPTVNTVYQAVSIVNQHTIALVNVFRNRGSK